MSSFLSELKAVSTLSIVYLLLTCRPLWAHPSCLVFYRESSQIYSVSADNLRQRILNSIVVHKNGQKELLGNVMYEVNPRAWELASSDPLYLLKAEELRMLDFILREIQPEHIIEFGPGDGSKAIRILKGSQTASDYTGIDINPNMMAVAKKKMEEELVGDDAVDVRFAEPIDLEVPITENKIKTKSGKNLGLFLGQTLGNPPPEKRAVVLQNMRKLLPSDSVFITGVALKPASSEMIQKNLNSYAIGQYNQLIMGPLKFLGLAEYGQLKIIWNDKENNVEAIFTFNQEVSLSNGLQFKPGEELIVFRSHRFTIEEIQDLWKDAGFIETEIILSQGFPYALVKAKTK